MGESHFFISTVSVAWHATVSGIAWHDGVSVLLHDTVRLPSAVSPGMPPLAVPPQVVSSGFKRHDGVEQPAGRRVGKESVGEWARGVGKEVAESVEELGRGGHTHWARRGGLVEGVRKATCRQPPACGGSRGSSPAACASPDACASTVARGSAEACGSAVVCGSPVA